MKESLHNSELPSSVAISTPALDLPPSTELGFITLINLDERR